MQGELVLSEDASHANLWHWQFTDSGMVFRGSAAPTMQAALESAESVLTKQGVLVGRAVLPSNQVRVERLAGKKIRHKSGSSGYEDLLRITASVRVG